MRDGRAQEALSIQLRTLVMAENKEIQTEMKRSSVGERYNGLTVPSPNFPTTPREIWNLI